MTHKTIDLSEEIYNKLMNSKHKDESISDVISRLLEKKEQKSNIKNFAGIFEKSSQEWEKIEKILYEDRTKHKKERILNF